MGYLNFGDKNKAMENEKSNWQSRLWRILKGLFRVVIAVAVIACTQARIGRRFQVTDVPAIQGCYWLELLSKVFRYAFHSEDSGPGKG